MRGIIYTILIMLTLCSCAHRSTYPVLPTTTERDPELTCPELDDEILKANALRDAIYDEHGEVLTQAVAEAALDTVFYTDPVFAAIDIFELGLRRNKLKQYIEAAAAAEQRMQQVLTEKDQRSCPSGPTADETLTDSLILGRLRDLDEQLQREELQGSEYSKQRRELFDALR
jgi:hypothetical protein